MSDHASASVQRVLDLLSDSGDSSGFESGQESSELVDKVVPKIKKCVTFGGTTGSGLPNQSGPANTSIIPVPESALMRLPGLPSLPSFANGQLRYISRVNMANGSLGPFMIGIAGGTASGKTSVCKTIMEKLGENSLSADKRKVACIVQDNFYRRLSPAESALAAAGSFNFDHPNALDISFMQRVLDDLLENRETQVPVYDFTTNSPKTNEFEKIFPADVVLVEGILAFYFKEIRELFDLKIFVEEDADIRLCRRIQRDVEDRGRDLDQILTQYMVTVKPAFEDFCQPTKKYADIIIPHGEENTVAINLIVQHIKEVLATRNGQTYTSGRAPRSQGGTSRSGLH